MRLLSLWVFTIVLITGIHFQMRAQEASLLRADPDSVPADAGLMAFATRAGEPLFQAHCANCHGVAGRGASTQGVPDLTDDDWLYGTGRVIDIQQTVTYGIRSYNPRGWNLAIMPGYARQRPSPTNNRIVALSPTEIRDLVEMLYHQQGRVADAAATARGNALYYGRGGCYDCHAFDMKGDSAIGAPNLTDRITLYGDGSKDALFDSIASGRRGLCPAWAGRMSAAQVLETALYTYSLSHRRSANAES